jgi:hypothetical protein
MALAGDIASVLESLGYGTWGGGTTPGASIFTQHEPDAPAACTTIYVTGGAPDMLVFDGSTYGERPVQIRFRDPDPAALEGRIESLYALWTAWKTYQTYFLRIKAATKPLYGYPQDQNGNFIASFNVTAIQGS